MTLTIYFVFFLSWKATSIDALASITPVNPPIVNNARNPSTHNIGAVNLNDPPYAVANQEKILIPVGTAITIVAAVKYARVSTLKMNLLNWPLNFINCLSF
jgi:hypothetical protein